MGDIETDRHRHSAKSHSIAISLIMSRWSSRKDIAVYGSQERTERFAHKGDLWACAGHCRIAEGKGGAAGLTALAALRAGCGLVTLGHPGELSESPGI